MRLFARRWRMLLIGTAGLVIGVQVLGNGAIWASSVASQILVPTLGAPDVDGIGNLRVVDDRVWRGARPTAVGYQSLADRGVTTIVDLRSESAAVPEALLGDLGIELVRVPVRDGQLPTDAQIARVLDAIDASTGRVFIHCAAGVGRTGSIVAAYLLQDGGVGRWGALLLNLEVGPPSLEQIAFVAGANAGGPDEPTGAVVAISRFLDAPRLLWGRLG